MVAQMEVEDANLNTDRAEDLGASNQVDENMQEGNNASNEEDESSSWDSGWSSSTSSSSASSSSDSCTSLSNLAGTAADKSLSQLSLENFLEHEVGITDFTNPLLGGGTLYGYPPILSSPTSQPSSSQDKQWQLQSCSTSDQTNAKTNGIMYIQMQYCKTTMRDMIDKSKLTIETVWKSLIQILEALVYIHGRNVIHRDLKPAK